MLCFLLADDTNFSIQSPVLVNRGWVPRSWRDKALESSQDLGEDKNIPNSASLSDENRSFWRFWSKKPQTAEVYFALFLFMLHLVNVLKINHILPVLQVQDPAPSDTPVEVVGVIRGSENPSIFVPGNDPTSGQWFFVDVPAIANASGLQQNAVYIEDINENVSPINPYPVPKDASTLIRSSVMPQDHLNYTFTWYVFFQSDFVCNCCRSC